MKETIVQKADTTLLVHVNVAGVPRPSVSWTLNNEPLISTNGCNIETSDTFSTLTLKNVSGTQSGELTVKAENCVDTASASFTVQILGKFIKVLFEEDYMFLFYKPSRKLFLKPKSACMTDSMNASK